MLGGWQSGLPKVHSSEKKKSMSSVMELCHFPRWERKPTLVLIHWVSEVMQLLLLEMKYFIMPMDSSTVVILVVIITVYIVSMLIPLYGRSYLLLLIMVIGYCNDIHYFNLSSVQLNGEDYFLVIGGQGATYNNGILKQPDTKHIGYCNDIHYFNLSSGQYT